MRLLDFFAFNLKPNLVGSQGQFWQEIKFENVCLYHDLQNLTTWQVKMSMNYYLCIPVVSDKYITHSSVVTTNADVQFV